MLISTVLQESVCLKVQYDQGYDISRGILLTAKIYSGQRGDNKLRSTILWDIFSIFTGKFVQSKQNLRGKFLYKEIMFEATS